MIATPSLRSAPAARQPASIGSLLPFGCLGIAIGVLVGSIGFVAAMLLSAAGGTVTPPAATGAPDITISVDESYLQSVLGESMPELPSGLLEDLQLDLQPEALIEYAGTLHPKLLGFEIEGDLAGSVRLLAEAGRLRVELESLEIFGFNMPGFETIGPEISSMISDVAGDQINQGLGDAAYLLSIDSDEETLYIEADIE